jgi:glucokinase
MRPVAGLDIGATTIRAAVADDDGHLQATATEPTPEDSDAAVDTIQTVLRSVADGADIPFESVSAVGIGSMGPLDHDAGCVLDPPNVPGVERIPVLAAVEALHDGRIVLHNDAIAAAIGERYYSEKPIDNLVYLTLSSGIGAGAIVDGEVLSGSTGNAAELGHITVAPDSQQRCGCGGVGHWEALCSGHAIPRTARSVAEETDIETDLDLGAVTAPDIFEAVGTDPLADRVVERLAEWNALGVAAAIHAYDPETIHIGGAVATNNPDAIVDRLRRRLPAHVIGEVPTVAVTPLGSDAVLRGAVASALEQGADRR